MTKVGIIQSGYLPWKGYFDIINDVDVFVFLDNVQYTKQDWRSRNKIKVPDGVCWLTVPAGSSLNRTISEVRINSTRDWQKKHYRSLLSSYGQAPYFNDYKWLIDDIYLGQRWESLSLLNQYSIRKISEILGIKTKLVDSSVFTGAATKNGRLLTILEALDADLYVSGPSAKSYISEEKFRSSGIELQWKDYSGYPEYEQMHPPFRHDVTILDLIFNKGDRASYYIWGWRNIDRDLRQEFNSLPPPDR